MILGTDDQDVSALESWAELSAAAGPSFRLAYALPQDGIDKPADWNNLGTYQSQPLSASVASITATMTPGTATGTYDAVLSTIPFPAGATMRAVAMDGYFTQTNVGIARHTPSPVLAVTGDAKRRAIINYEGCLDCHERLELHGGSRVLAADTDPNSPAVCVLCHDDNSLAAVGKMHSGLNP